MEIIFESEALLVINKPAGISVHSDGKTNAETVADWFLKKYPYAKNVGEPAVLSDGTIVARPGIVHRLDKDTSGCLVLAKTQQAYAQLKKQFKQHTVQKEYHAFVYGRLSRPRGTITAPIGRATGSVEKRTTGSRIRGVARAAQTIYRLVNSGVDVSGVPFSFVAFFPKTGRTHQIRVHALALHHPVVADSLYKGGHVPILGFKRQALHAYRLTFKDAMGVPVTVIASYPDDFVHALAILPKK